MQSLLEELLGGTSLWYSNFHLPEDLKSTRLPMMGYPSLGISGNMDYYRQHATDILSELESAKQEGQWDRAHHLLNQLDQLRFANALFVEEWMIDYANYLLATCIAPDQIERTNSRPVWSCSKGLTWVLAVVASFLHVLLLWMETLRGPQPFTEWTSDLLRHWIVSPLAPKCVFPRGCQAVPA